MNRIQRSEYSDKNTRRLKRFEREYLPEMYRLISRQFKRAASNVRQGKPATDQLAWDTDIQTEITNLYNTVGVFYTAKTLREINASSREQKAFGFDPEWIARIQEYFRLNLLNKAVLPISETTRDEILRILTQGEQEGWGTDRMAFELENSTLPLYRARMIVRTEILKAQHYGKQLGAEESEFETVKQWISAKNHRTRHSHRLVDGEMVDVNGRFRVGRKKGGFDLMAGPGDPEASAENVINCRCTTAVVAKRDEEGRLIMKGATQPRLPAAYTTQQLDLSLPIVDFKKPISTIAPKIVPQKVEKPIKTPILTNISAPVRGGDDVAYLSDLRDKLLRKSELLGLENNGFRSVEEAEVIDAWADIRDIVQEIGGYTYSIEYYTRLANELPLGVERTRYEGKIKADQDRLKRKIQLGLRKGTSFERLLNIHIKNPKVV